MEPYSDLTLDQLLERIADVSTRLQQHVDTPPQQDACDRLRAVALLLREDQGCDQGSHD